MTRLAEEVLADPRVTIYTRAAVARAEGYVGNFTLFVEQQPGGVVIDAAARLDGAPGRHFRAFEGYVLAAERRSWRGGRGGGR